MSQNPTHIKKPNPVGNRNCYVCGSKFHLQSVHREMLIMLDMIKVLDHNRLRDEPIPMVKDVLYRTYFRASGLGVLKLGFIKMIPKLACMEEHSYTMLKEICRLTQGLHCLYYQVEYMKSSNQNLYCFTLIKKFHQRVEQTLQF